MISIPINTQPLTALMLLTALMCRNIVYGIASLFLLAAMQHAVSLPVLSAQEPPHAAATARLPVYGLFGIGFGQTLFFGDIRTKLAEAIGAREFAPNTGFNTVLGFTVAPEAWDGLGLGARAKVFAATPSRGTEGERYFFNYYHAGMSAMWYALSGRFNDGAYVRASVGFGQLTAKRDDGETANEYRHQFAVGTTLLGGLGYSFPLGSTSLSIEAEFEHSSRNGTISRIGEGQVFQSGQLGINCIITF